MYWILGFLPEDLELDEGDEGTKQKFSYKNFNPSREQISSNIGRTLRARVLRVRVLRISNDLKNGICKTCQIFDYVAPNQHWILF